MKMQPTSTRVCIGGSSAYVIPLSRMPGQSLELCSISKASATSARAFAYLPSTYMYFSGLWGWEVCQPQGVMLASYSWHLWFVPLRRRRHRSPSRPRRIRYHSLTRMCFAKRKNSLNCCCLSSADAHRGWRNFVLLLAISFW